MVTSKQVQQSQQGEVKAQQTDSSFQFPNLIGEVTAAASDVVIFKLVNRQRRKWIDGICDGVLNPKTGKRERIWLIRGADSIWQSELGELLKDKTFISKNRVSLLFEHGVCRVPKDDELMVEFARRNTKNVGDNRSGSGKWDYYEYNAAHEQKLRLSKEMSKLDLVFKVRDMKEDKMTKLALFLGIMPYDELGQRKGEDGIRTELILRANSNPDEVGKYIDSKEVEIAYMVRRAILDAKIDLTAQEGTALWAGGKGFIGKIPRDRKAYEYLTELAMTNSNEGRQFKEQLETMSVT